MIVEVGDLVALKSSCSTTLGIVYEVYIPKLEVKPGQHRKSPRAKIFMKNGHLYEFLVEDLIVHTKGKDNGKSTNTLRTFN